MLIVWNSSGEPVGEALSVPVANHVNLAISLHGQGRYADAEQAFRDVLRMTRQLRGEEHPDTAARYDDLALNLHAQGRYGDAEDACRKAADAFAHARLRVAPTGLGRAAFGGKLNSLPLYPTLLARNRKHNTPFQPL